MRRWLKYTAIACGLLIAIVALLFVIVAAMSLAVLYDPAF